MGDQLRSNLLAGFVAGFIWMFITAFTGMDRTTTALVGLGFVVVVALITAVVSRTIGSSHTRRS